MDVHGDSRETAHGGAHKAARRGSSRGGSCRASSVRQLPVIEPGLHIACVSVGVRLVLLQRRKALLLRARRDLERHMPLRKVSEQASVHLRALRHGSDLLGKVRAHLRRQCPADKVFAQLLDRVVRSLTRPRCRCVCTDRVASSRAGCGPLLLLQLLRMLLRLLLRLLPRLLLRRQLLQRRARARRHLHPRATTAHSQLVNALHRKLLLLLLLLLEGHIGR